MANHTDWNRFPVEAISTATFLKRGIIHGNLLWAAWRRAGGSVLEVGVGSGAQSAALSRLVGTVTIDNDLRILTAARPNLRRFGRGISQVAADGFTLPFRSGSFGVAVSQGLMEHFSDDRIGDLLREQLRVCRAAVFSVPSDRYPRQDVGDERLLSPEEWKRIVSSQLVGNRYHIRSRYYRFDLEAVKYSVLARRRLGSFSVLVTIDPR